MSDTPTILYRYEDEFRDYGVEVRLRTFRVLRATPKGVWIDCNFSDRFVLLQGRKRFAHPTIAEARASFAARKKRQIAILRAHLHHAEQALERLEEVPA